MATVIVYENKNLRGKSLTIRLSGKEVGRLYSIRRTTLNDKMSSVKWSLPDNVNIRFYEHPDGTGRTYTRGGGTGQDSDTHNNDFKDCASAYRFLRADPEPPTDFFMDIPAVLVRQLFDGQMLTQIAGTRAYYIKRTSLDKLDYQTLKVTFHFKADIPGFDPEATVTADIKIETRDGTLTIKILAVRVHADSAWWQEVITTGSQEAIDDLVERVIENQVRTLTGLTTAVPGGLVGIVDTHVLVGGSLRLFFREQTNRADEIRQYIQSQIGGSIWFFEDNGCEGNIVGALTHTTSQRIEFGPAFGFTNDAARSIRLVNVRQGAKIRVFDDSGGDQNKAWVEITVKQQFAGSYCIGSFERSFSDEVVNVSYRQDGGLDGKVSRVEVL